MIYLVPKPPDRLGRKYRESGWRHVPLDALSRKELAERVEPLKDKHITAVYVSDLDIESGEVVRDVLHVTVRPDYCLRRFNVGRHHAAASSIMDGILREQVEKWKTNKDVPVR